MKIKYKLQLVSIVAVAVTGCMPSGPALNLADFNDKLSGCFIADNYASPQCKLSQKVATAHGMGDLDGTVLQTH